MRAYLIDPAARTITEVDHVGDYRDIQKITDCDCITVAEFNGDTRDCVYIDDNGLLHGPRDDFFVIEGYPQPLAGKGLVLGTDEEGDSVAPQVDLAWLKANVRFVTAREAVAIDRQNQQKFKADLEEAGYREVSPGAYVKG